MKKTMRKIVCLVMALLMVLSSFVMLSSCSTTDPEDKPDTGDSVAVSDSEFVHFTEGFTDTQVHDEKSAIEAAGSVASQLGLTDAEKELKVENVTIVDEDSYYRLQQYYNDIPVYGRSVVVAANADGEVTALTANSISVGDNIKLDPEIKMEEAVRSVEKYIKDELVSDRFEVTTYAKDSAFVIYSSENNDSVLAYNLISSITVPTGGFYNYEFIIDAHSGEVLKHYSLDLQDAVKAVGKDTSGKQRSFYSDKKSDTEYVLKDTDRNLQVYDLGHRELTYNVVDADGNALTSISGSEIDHVEYLADGNNNISEVISANNEWNDAKAVTLMANLTDTYDFYSQVLSHNGTNKNKNSIKAFYNDTMPANGSDNAYCWELSIVWQDEVALSFGEDNSMSMDTVAHEYTHAVERYLVGMNYEGESGAIMEAYSDIFGELAEDWKNDGEMNGDCDWIHNDLRSLRNPSEIPIAVCSYLINGQNCPVYEKKKTHGYNKEYTVTKNTCMVQSDYPSRYNDENWAFTEGEYDNGGVHINHTVISHAAYLMWNGIDGTDAQRIDTQSLAKLWYRALQLLQSNATFSQCANAVLVSAQQMRSSHLLSDEQVACVEAAFNAVGIPFTTSYAFVANGSTIYAMDATNEKSYNNYHIKIESCDPSTGETKTVEEVDIRDENGYTFDLENGLYIVTVTDNDSNGSHNAYQKKLRVFSFATSSLIQTVVLKPQNVYITTDFISAIPVDSMTMPSEMVITLGENSVIEPEILPADASHYSIKWTSSDESVASVAPTGDAGIITSIAKGTATITAELTCGDKTITKTTKLRVASKARDTILVLDVSGSMSGTPMEEMKKSAIQFCNDLLKDEYNNRVGLVFYDNDITTVDLTDDLDMLVDCIENVYPGGTTNMEGGLATANTMMQNQGKSDAIKNVVIMADGLPNEGITSDSGSMPVGIYTAYAGSSELYANAVIDTGKAMMNSYNMYSLGFFHDLSGVSEEFGVALMQELTNQTDGYHQVDRAEDLQFAFGDISETITTGSKIVINIACPVDVTVSCGGEKLSSVPGEYSDVASFGTLQLMGKNKDIKVLSLDSDKVYDVKLFGTGVGTMDYSVTYFDESEQLVDYRSFEQIPITPTTVITSNTDNSIQDIALNIDEDGDGEIDTIWTALAKSVASITYQKDPNPPQSSQPAESQPESEPEPEFSEAVATTQPVETVQFSILATALIGVCVVVIFALVITVAVVVSHNGQSGGFDNEPIPVFPPKSAEKPEKEYPVTEDDPYRGGYIEITSGSMAGLSVPIKDGQTLYLGKDPQKTNIVFSADYSNVSRLHCAISYSAAANKYYVIDCSSNGTYFNNKMRLEKGKRTPVNAKTILLLANDACTILLG